VASALPSRAGPTDGGVNTCGIGDVVATG
jgi:hypothetical protein